MKVKNELLFWPGLCICPRFQLRSFIVSDTCFALLSSFPLSAIANNKSFYVKLWLSAISCMVIVDWYNTKDAFTPQMKGIFLILLCWLRKEIIKEATSEPRPPQASTKKTTSHIICSCSRTHTHTAPASFSIPSPGLWKYTHWLSTCRITHAHIWKKVQLWNKNLEQWGAFLCGRA